MLLVKGIYPYEYMDNCERFDETSLPDKETFDSNLNEKSITDVHYRHAKRIFKIFDKKNLGDYHDLYVQNDILLIADVFENLRNKCIEIYELDPANFLSGPALVWQGALKKADVQSELLTDNVMLLMV